MKARPFYSCRKDQRIYIEVDPLQDVTQIISQPVIQGGTCMFAECRGCRYPEMRDVISQNGRGRFPVIKKMGFCELRFEGIPEDGE